MMNRYYNLLDSLTELIKTVVRMETKTTSKILCHIIQGPLLVSLAQEVCKLLESLPKYNQAVFELLRTLTDLTM